MFKRESKTVNPSARLISNQADNLGAESAYLRMAGQWSYSPAGLPVSLITGNLAADKIHKLLRKQANK
jgi:hypothetical protein